jgi:hypothetical protein
MKCDVPRSVCLAQEEWDLLDDTVAQGGYHSRNDLIRRCIHHGLLSLQVAGLCPVALHQILKEARGHLLVSNRLRHLLVSGNR